MLTRIQLAAGPAFLLTLALTSPALAKGNFSFLAISGGNLNNEVRTADVNLVSDWFAFADFQGGSVSAPAKAPEGGYVVTRYYVDGLRTAAFDRLHYYPAAGLVYYDGLLGGSSEYDGKWYTARPGIQPVFERAVFREEMRHALLIARS